MFEFDDNDLYAKIKVVYSGNVNEYIGDVKLEGVEFISIDDKSNDAIAEALKGADMVFIIADQQTPNIAEMSREIGALTVAIVDSEDKAGKAVDSFFVVDDDSKTAIPQIIKAIADLIAVPGLVNLDFLDLKTILGNAGRAYAGTGEAQGDTATVDAVKAAIAHTSNIAKSRSLMLNILGASNSLSMMEVNEASVTVQEAVHEDAEIIWGVSVEEALGDKIIATIIATNFAE